MKGPQPCVHFAVIAQRGCGTPPDFLAPFKVEAKELHEFEYSYFQGLVAESERGVTQDSTTAQRPRAWIEAYIKDKGFWDLTEFEIAYSMGTLLEGGTGTTSSAMQSFYLAMWHYPDWQAKVQKEIDRVVGDRVPSFDDWPDLPTVRAAMKETSVGGRLCLEVCTLLSTYYSELIKVQVFRTASRKTTAIMASSFPKAPLFMPTNTPIRHVQGRKHVPQCKSIILDRWLNPEYPTFQAPLTKFPNLQRNAAFGFGRRICPGLALAERELFIEITMLMWACSVI